MRRVLRMHRYDPIKVAAVFLLSCSSMRWCPRQTRIPIVLANPFGRRWPSADIITLALFGLRRVRASATFSSSDLGRNWSFSVWSTSVTLTLWPKRVYRLLRSI